MNDTIIIKGCRRMHEMRAKEIFSSPAKTVTTGSVTVVTRILLLLLLKRLYGTIPFERFVLHKNLPGRRTL